MEALKEGNKKIKWKDRKPYAFWKGNPYVSKKRVELMKCNVSNKNDWNVRLYIQVNFFIQFLDFYFKEHSYNSSMSGQLFSYPELLLRIFSKRKDIKYLYIKQG